MTTSNALRTDIRRICLIIAVVAAVVTVLFTPQFVQAQGRGPESESRRPGHGPDREFLAAVLGITVDELNAAYEAAKEAGESSDLSREELLANALGITVEELEIAQAEAREAALVQAVEDGKITAEEADLIRAQWRLKTHIDHDALVAAALGITVEDLEAARDAGQDVRDLLEELGIDHETFKANLDAAYTAAVQAAVDAGVVTQDEADAILAGDVGRGPGGDDGGRGHRPPGPPRDGRPGDGNNAGPDGQQG